MSTEIYVNNERLKVWFRNSTEDYSIEGNTHYFSALSGSQYSVDFVIKCTGCGNKCWAPDVDLDNGISDLTDEFELRGVCSKC